jgi:hypothetical protein
VKETLFSIEPMGFLKQKRQTDYRARANKNITLANGLVEVDNTSYFV